ncbi:hypothetical protein TRAPUB_1711 [Trametes pubescens]|uniref:DUF6532 domain-containing protein n=1 Tax=Trametes pubescens TaxID=154538 RepID=A0A1M2VIM1_TRAPU|nr:hypothetical protein TRAPUB_3122 [Trametes pubescens]OJT07435.1 hypothetical protein TRAPUB_1711 [Trametes pubescens]
MTRGRKRIILSDDSDNNSNGHGAAAIAAAPTGLDSGRPSRRTKEEAKKKWETLVPGQVRKKKKSDTGLASDSDADLKHRKSTKAVKSSYDNSAQSHRSSGKSTARVSACHPPDIDPNASSEGEDNVRKEDSIHVTRTKGSKPHTNSDGDFSKKSVPPKYQKCPAPDIVQDLDNEPTSSEEDDQEDDSTNEDKQEEYNTDKEDEELQAMEKHPQMLAKTFAQEAAYWVEEDNELSPSRPQRHSRSKSLASARAPTPQSSSHSRHSSRPPPSSRSPSRSALEDADTAKKHTKSQTKAPATTIGKKRVAREDSDAAESDAPPPKKLPRKATHGHASRVHDKTKVHSQAHDTPRSHASGKAATKTKSANPSTKNAPKRAKSKHEDEIPKILKISDDASSETRKSKTKSKTMSASSKAALSKTALSAAGSDEDSAVDDASSSESESEDSGIEIVLPAKGKLKLKEQHRRVRRVLKRGIHTMLVNVGLKNAFPDGPQKPGEVIYRALLKAAAEFGYDDLIKRLKKQDELAPTTIQPSQRIPTFRGQVRKLVEGQPGTALGLISGDREKGDWLQEGLHYIYPFDYETKTIQAGKPYSPPVFIETLRVAFFKRPSSLGFELSKQFESSLPNKPDEKELPAPMLALVATALHAAIEDCKYGHKQPCDFSSNDYWNVYKDHIQELSSIRRDGPLQYHVLMHGLWRQISTPMGSSAHAGAPRKSFLDIAAMPLE